jgi:hypothetical protein
VDLATGDCALQPAPLLRPRTCFSAVRLPDTRSIVCVGRLRVSGDETPAKVLTLNPKP